MESRAWVLSGQRTDQSFSESRLAGRRSALLALTGAGATEDSDPDENKRRCLNAFVYFY